MTKTNDHFKRESNMYCNRDGYDKWQKNPQTISQKRNWLWEFTKKIVWIVTIMFVTVYTFSCILLIFYPDSSAIQFIIENMSDVFKVTVVAYVVKAGFENVCKIRRNPYGMDSEQLGNDTDNSDGNSRGG